MSDTTTGVSAPVSASVSATLGFLTRGALDTARSQGPRTVDYRMKKAGPGLQAERRQCVIRNARSTAGLGLSQSGFQLVGRPSAVQDWFDEEEVMRVYYQECKTIAQELTGASHTFTFDHLIREPGIQTAGGGLAGKGGNKVSGRESGGGYVGGVHMDYTEHSVWAEYLALHGLRAPVRSQQVVVLNFWRPLLNVVENDPLAVCDARSVLAEDLLACMIFGYGHPGYSWHDIGVSVYEVAYSDRHQWYYYPQMTPDEVLIMKTYDSSGVIGTACPHASFADPLAPTTAPPRRSIELRVLCFITGT